MTPPPLSAAQTERILAAALLWLGTPYHHAARVRGAGVDCAQLLIAVYAEDLGLFPVPEVWDYPKDWMLHRAEERFMEALQAHADPVDEPLPGDVALWKFGRCFAHAGIVVGWPRILHADGHVGRVTLGCADEGRVAGKPVRFYRMRGAA
ncbi:MAG: NlpC/P60 family protein [Candidatus Dactylopiibacterium sp.]|nr:NlpC/P60 family protein [Candidatus Dactylopiibacterium sp.]